MADDLTNRGPADRPCIKVDEAHELAYWTEPPGGSADELKAAVKAVGVMVADVRKHLGK